MVEVVEAEKGEEGGGSGPGAVVDIEVVGSARGHNFKMRMGISQWMIWNGTTKAAKFDSKVEINYCGIVIYILCFIYSRPYTSRSSSSGAGEASGGRSVFNRLGGPPGGAFARLSGLGGDRRGESWHKVTVSSECTELLNPWCIAWPRPCCVVQIPLSPLPLFRSSMKKMGAPGTEFLVDQRNMKEF